MGAPQAQEPGRFFTACCLQPPLKGPPPTTLSSSKSTPQIPTCYSYTLMPGYGWTLTVSATHPLRSSGFRRIWVQANNKTQKLFPLLCHRWKLSLLRQKVIFLLWCSPKDCQPPSPPHAPGSFAAPQFYDSGLLSQNHTSVEFEKLIRKTCLLFSS